MAVLGVRIFKVRMAKPGNPRIERGRGGWEGGGREGEREREASREGGARAKPGNQM